MLNEPLSLFFDQLNELSDDTYKFISEDHSSRTFRLPDIEAVFTLELSEARIHSRILRSGVVNSEVWDRVLSSVSNAQNLKSNIDILIWSGESLINDAANVKEPKDITQIELTSKLINIYKKDDLHLAIASTLDLTDFIFFGVLFPIVQEGRLKKSIVKKYERSKILRDSAISLHGLNCIVCSFNFEEKYGDIGREFIHIHHLERLADSGLRIVNPLTDLVPVCPNCHSMLHKVSPPLNPFDLKQKLR